MAQVNVSVEALPPGGRVYQYAQVAEPGTAAAKNFFSHFNPVGSGKLMFPLGIVIQSFSASNTSVANPLTLFRTSADSGGTLVAASSITRWIPSDPDPSGTIRNNNPAATTTGLALIGIAPYLGSGGGGTVPALVAPFSVAPLIPPGTGILFRQTAGETAQLWNIQYTWMEL